MSNLFKFSKNKFYNFLNYFIFKFSFLLFQSHFQIHFQKHFEFWIQPLIEYKSNAHACMHIHVATPYNEF